MSTLYDHKCLELATHFLDEEGAFADPALIPKLAEHIQVAVDEWFASGPSSDAGDHPERTGSHVYCHGCSEAAGSGAPVYHLPPACSDAPRARRPRRGRRRDVNTFHHRSPRERSGSRRAAVHWTRRDAQRRAGRRPHLLADDSGNGPVPGASTARRRRPRVGPGGHSMKRLTLAALALLLFAALPAGGQTLTPAELAVVRTLEQVYPGLGLRPDPRPGVPAEIRWHDPAAGQEVPWREWLAKWYPGGYDAWSLNTRAHSKGCHLLELDIAKIAQHSALLSPWVYRDRRGRAVADTRLLLPGEARICPIFTAWNKASNGPPVGECSAGWTCAPIPPALWSDPKWKHRLVVDPEHEANCYRTLGFTLDFLYYVDSPRCMALIQPPLPTPPGPVCGDGTCDAGEACPEDCAPRPPECPPCPACSTGRLEVVLDELDAALENARAEAGRVCGEVSP